MYKDKEIKIKFLPVFFISLLFSACMVFCFNFIMDPFNLAGIQTFEGINKVKPKIFDNTRLIKAHQLVRMKPKGLILGTSRAETGLNPAHPGWSQDSRPVYNAALSSARIYEIYRYLQHAETSGHLNQVLIGLDYFSFDTNKISEPGFDEKRLNLKRRAFPNFYLIKDMLTCFMTYKALFASYETLKGQHQLTKDYFEDGSRDTSRLGEKIKIAGGTYMVFDQTLKRIITANDGIGRINYSHDSGDNIISLNWFRKLVYFCSQNKIKLYLVISPPHAQWLEVLWQLDGWNNYEQWKRDITRIVEEEKGRNSNDSLVELWDFSGFNRISMEKTPGPEDKDFEMQWYWEATHYKRVTGNLILDKVLLGEKKSVVPGFGVRLSFDNIENHLLSIRNGKERFEKENPGIVKYIHQLISVTKRFENKKDC